MNGRSFDKARPERLHPLLMARAIRGTLLGLLLVLALVPAHGSADPGACSYWVYIDPRSVPNGAMGESYSVQYTGHDVDHCGLKTPYHFSVYHGALPTGLTLSDNGLLSGVLAAPGDFPFTVAVRPDDGIGWGQWDFSVTVTGTNHQPTFTSGGDVTVLEDAPPYSAIWATSISKGGPADAGQTLGFHLSNDNNALFSVQPALATDGMLSFTVNPSIYGVANVSVYLSDNGGTANGGISNSSTEQFKINVVHPVQPGPIFTVNSNAPTNDHDCAVSHCTLREAVEAANTFGLPAIVELAEGATYTLSEADNGDAGLGLNGLPVISDDITINGHGARIERSASAPAFRLVSVNPGKALALNRVEIVGFIANQGGAIVNSGDLSLAECTVSSNSATSSGGAIDNGYGTLSVTNSTFVGNTATLYGGAIRDYGGRLAVTNSTFSSNDGGTYGGGGIFSEKGVVSVVSSTFADNTGGAGRAIRMYDGSATLTNTLLANGGSNCYGATFSASAWNMADDNTCDSATVRTGADIKLGALTANGGPTQTRALLAGSVAIDKGSTTGCQDASIMGRDQRRYYRFANGDADGIAQCDLGAFEYASEPLPELPTRETIPPEIGIELAPTSPDGADGWYRSPVTVQPQADDDSAVIELRCTLDPQVAPATYDDLPEELCPFLTGAQVSADGLHTFYAAAMDLWGNKSEVVSAPLQIDATPPVISCPEDGLFLLHSGEHTVGPAGVDAAVSGLDEAASTLTGLVPTDSIGPKAVTFTAVDLAGNSATKECTYAVIYDFGGFYPPVEPEPALNAVKAGSAAPLKFSLGGDQGLDVIAEGYPTSQPVDCDTQEPLGPAAATETAGKSALSYHAGSGRYNYVWKTDKAWAGKCRVLALQLADGSEHLAAFRFK